MLSGWGGATISSQDCAMPRLADPSTPTLPLSHPTSIWGRLLCYIMETDYMEALTPICVSLTKLAERQLHTKDERGQHKQEQARWVAPLHQLEGLGRWATPCLRPFPLLQEAGRSPESQALPKRPPLPKSEEVKAVYASSGSPLISSPPPAHPGPDPR